MHDSVHGWDILTTLPNPHAYSRSNGGGGHKCGNSEMVFETVRRVLLTESSACQGNLSRHEFCGYTISSFDLQGTEL